MGVPRLGFRVRRCISAAETGSVMGIEELDPVHLISEELPVVNLNPGLISAAVCLTHCYSIGNGPRLFNSSAY